MRAPLGALLELLDRLDRDHTSVVELICGTRAPEPWTLYPGEFGVFDRTTASQFYFHAHDGRHEELGHFHTVRLFRNRTVHLVAISIGTDGRPRCLSTLNLWAIGDSDAPAADLRRYVTQFRIAERHGQPRVVRFVNLVFHAFRSEILQLQDMKAASLAEYRAAHAGSDPFEDRGLEILSRIDVRPMVAA